VLMGNSASLLRKALQDSGHGSDVLGGLSDELKQSTFSAGLRGVREEDVEKVEEVVLRTLQTVSAPGGLDPEAVWAAVNSTEFSLREFNTGSFPRGLSFMLGSLSHWSVCSPTRPGLLAPLPSSLLTPPTLPFSMPSILHQYVYNSAGDVRGPFHDLCLTATVMTFGN